MHNVSIKKSRDSCHFYPSIAMILGVNWEILLSLCKENLHSVLSALKSPFFFLFLKKILDSVTGLGEMRDKLLLASELWTT